MSRTIARIPLPQELQSFVRSIRRKYGGKVAVPSFDPENGNLSAKYLLILEAPGPKAIATGIISLSNDDPTARNLKRQLDAAGVRPRDIAVWNIVPWFVSHSAKRTIRAVTRDEVIEGSDYLLKLASMMPMLKCIVLIGKAASSAHIYLSARTGSRLLACHHPSQRWLNRRPQCKQENIEVFKRMQHA